MTDPSVVKNVQEADRMRRMDGSMLLLLFLVLSIPLVPALAESSKSGNPLIVAHYMPWYEAPPVSAKYGWHWTMNHFDPAKIVHGMPEAASKYHPLIGLYDSSDPYVLECHVLMMKYTGIDGVIVDWYGNDDCLDYKRIHQNTLSMIEFIRRAGMLFAVMFEDRTVPQLIERHVVSSADVVSHGQHLMGWVERNWFSSSNQLRIDGRPAFFLFGPEFYMDGDLSSLFENLKHKPMLLTLRTPRGPALGAFDWPMPQGGSVDAKKKLDEFYAHAKDWTVSVPCAYPRFDDIYDQAGVHPSWGHIDDANGKTYLRTLKRALTSAAPVVQVATWNDWGEGTQIEPSVEFGYRDLESTQLLRRQLIDPDFSFTAANLRLPEKLYAMRCANRGNAERQKELDHISDELFQGGVEQAQRALEHFPSNK